MKGWIGDKYKKISVLGKGTNTTVFLCKVIDEDYDIAAVKVFNSRKEDELMENYFKRECDVLAMLNHENIVNILDQGYDKDNNLYYIALEYVDGKNLEELIKSKEIEKRDKQGIINQVLDAIEYAHNRNILHRDLKPSNIMITNDNKVKIIDFGISKILGSISTDGDNYTIQALTYKYASPEQKLGKTLTFQSDIYSLGLVLYEVLEADIFNLDNRIVKLIKNSKKIKEYEKRILLEMIEENLEKRTTNIYKIIRAYNSVNRCDNKVYSLGIAMNAISKLYDLRMILKSDKNNAISFIKDDLKTEIYFASAKNVYKDEKSDKYILWGQQVEYNCAIDKHNDDSLTIISINIPETHAIEKRKELFGYKVNEGIGFDVKKESRININKLINKYGESIKRKNNIIQENKNTEEIINKWSGILEIQKQLISNNRNTLRYQHLKYDKENRRLLLKIKGSIEEVDFTQDQMLVLTMKNTGRAFKTKRAGFFNDYKNGILSIDIIRGLSPDEFSESGEVSVDTAFMDSVISKQENALNKIKKSECLNKQLSHILSNPESARKIYLSDEIEFINKNLDESKQKIVEEALEAKDIYLLQGPPGTGKTTFITEIVNQQLLINPKSKILITSQSNVAVNHAMAKIKESNELIKVVRLGREEMINNGMEDYTLEAQLESLINDIKNKCNNYFNMMKERNFDSELLDKYNLVKEIIDIENTFMQLNNEISIDKEILNKYEKEYLLSLDFSSKINLIKEKLIDISSRVENEDRGNIELFINEYINIGDEIENSIIKANSLKENIGVAKDTIDEKEIRIENYIKAIEAGYDLLGINSKSELERCNDELEAKIKGQKSKLEQFGKLERIKKEWINKINNTEELGKIFIEDVSVIGATCIGIANYYSNFDLSFDLVIIDEAGRATPPELFVPMILGKKIILVGDHKQLPPVVDKVLSDEVRIRTNYKRYELEESLFAYLQDKLNDNCKGILREQYRMHPVIGDLISETFYNNSIISMVNKDSRDHGYDKFGKNHIVWLDTVNDHNKYEENIGTTKQNRLEADKVVELLIDLNRTYKNKGIKKEVAIITGYKAQKNLIIRQLERYNIDEFANISIEVDTVDAFQGRETDIVIYSIVRSNTEGNLGFLKDSRRLNVSLSRGRELLIIIGDSQCIKVDKNNPFSNVYDYILNNEKCIIMEV